MNLKQLHSLVSLWDNCFKLHYITNNLNPLSVAQASSSFKCIDTRTPMYATPTFVIEALRLVTYVQLF